LYNAYKAQCRFRQTIKLTNFLHIYLTEELKNSKILEMWANAQRDGRPAEYRWRPLFNAATFG